MIRTPARIAVIVALAGAAQLALSGQERREWRDYAGGPDSSRYVAATQITKANVGQLLFELRRNREHMAALV